MIRSKLIYKYFFFSNIKKYYFYQDRFYFLEYIVLFKNINIKIEKIKVVKDWLKPKSI